MKDFIDPPAIPPKGRMSITFNWISVPHGMDIVLRARKLGEMHGHDVAYALCDALLVACKNYNLDPDEVFEESLEMMDSITTRLIEEDDDADQSGPHGGFMP